MAPESQRRRPAAARRCARHLGGRAAAPALALCWCRSALASVRPNLLLIFPDEWRWDWAGFDPEEADLRVPNLRRLAEQGTRFKAAYTPSPWCAPARACLASGKEFDESPQTLNGEDFPTNVPTWYQALRDAGYHTMLVGKDDLTQSLAGTHLDGSRHAVDLGINDWFRMQDKYVTYRRVPWDEFGISMAGRPCGLLNSINRVNLFRCNEWCYGIYGNGQCCKTLASEGYNCPYPDQVGLNQEEYIDNFVESQAELLLDRAPPGKPWAMHLSFPGPHPPFIITELMNQSIEGRHFRPARDNKDVPPDEQTTVRKQYAAEIENLDALFGRLLRKVAMRGEAHRTLVVVTADHGEQLGEQNAWGKRKPWEPSVRVPLIVRGPGVAKNRTVDLPVTTLDVIGTFLDRANAFKGDMAVHTLDPLMRARAAPDEAAYLKNRPFATTGLSFAGRPGKDPAVDFRALVRKVNATHTLKVICCPEGCPEGNSFVPSTAPEPQLLAFNVALGAQGDIEDLSWSAEARELARQLPGKYATACLGGGDGSAVFDPPPSEALPAEDGIPPPLILPPQIRPADVAAGKEPRAASSAAAAYEAAAEAAGPATIITATAMDVPAAAPAKRAPSFQEGHGWPAVLGAVAMCLALPGLALLRRQCRRRRGVQPHVATLLSGSEDNTC